MYIPNDDDYLLITIIMFGHQLNESTNQNIKMSKQMLSQQISSIPLCVEPYFKIQQRMIPKPFPGKHKFI